MEFPVSEISRINISLFYINFLVQITYFILAFESGLETQKMFSILNIVKLKKKIILSIYFEMLFF